MFGHGVPETLRARAESSLTAVQPRHKERIMPDLAQVPSKCGGRDVERYVLFNWVCSDPLGDVSRAV